MKRGQAAAAGSLLALLAVFIVLYILLLPPDVRQELLGDEPGTTGPNTENPGNIPRFNTTVLSVTPGRIDYLKFKQYEHPLAAVNLFSTSCSTAMDIGDSAYVKNGIFDKKAVNITFRLDDVDNLKNTMISFTISPNRNNQGRLIITLNGKEIYNKESGSLPAPIQVTNLQRTNHMDIEVTGVGWRFWTTNEYELGDIRLFYDEVDTSTQQSRGTFMVTDSEKFNLEKATLKFFPDCNPRDVGRLSAVLNNLAVYNAVPDCGQLNVIELSPGNLEAGMNRLDFSADEGQYLITHISVDTELKSMVYPVYYFDLPSQIFTVQQDDNNDEDCGDIDGICPRNCDDDQDMDCCLQETSNYWCDYQPHNQDDRCRAIRRYEECQLCPSGYEDMYGEPPEECQDRCGDDTDNECPEHCSRFYDQDCCFEDDPENFWCDEIPLYGLATCKEAITNQECDACPSGWRSDESGFVCSAPYDDDTDAQLKSNYDVYLTLKFTDSKEQKAGKVFVNGYQFQFTTYDDEYRRIINTYVDDDTNSVKIEPDQTVLDIRQLLIEVED